MKPGERRCGRAKGTPNKSTALLKDAILRAAELAGNDISNAADKKAKLGLVNYLKNQAHVNPKAFLPLLAKVLPLQLTGDGGGPIQTEQTVTTDEALLLIAKLQKTGALDR